jgi:hypothetical protein
MNFSAIVTHLKDFDAVDNQEEYRNCVEVVVRGIRGMANYGDSVVLSGLDPDGAKYTFLFKGLMLGKREGRQLETGELPMVLEKPPELAGRTLTSRPGLSLESL